MKSPLKSPIKSILSLIFISALIAIAVVTSQLYGFATRGFGPLAQDTAIVEITKNSRPHEVAKLLRDQGLVSSADKFVLLGRVLRRWSGLKAGEYEISPRMTPLEIFSIINSGISMAHVVTIPEGANLFQVADEIEAKGLAKKNEFVAACRDPEFIQELGFKDPLPPSLEGYLFPNTYYFVRAMKVKEMIRQMVRLALATYEELPHFRAEEHGLTRHQIFTLASIIEKETGAPQERPMISSVFHNRLRKKMRLQSDPTSIYGIWETYHGNITRSILHSANPYNTYTNPALPIGPIANPGREALRAALVPAQSEFLFFVSMNNGTHKFTSTLKDHQGAVTQFQLDRKAREGKSWRDLQKTLKPGDQGYKKPTVSLPTEKKTPDSGTGARAKSAGF